MSSVTVRCQFCERLFIMERPLFVGERDRATCQGCTAEARRNTDAMRPPKTSNDIARKLGLSR